MGGVGERTPGGWHESPTQAAVGVLGAGRMWACICPCVYERMRVRQRVWSLLDLCGASGFDGVWGLNAVLAGKSIDFLSRVQR